MATEALATDQTTERQVDEMILTEDISSCSKGLQEKIVENINKESTNLEEPATESAPAIVSEEKQEDEKSESVAAEEVKKEEKDETVEIENTKQETDSSSAVEPTVEAEQKELKNQTDATVIPEEIPQVSSSLDKEIEAKEAPGLPIVIELATDVVTSGDVSGNAEIPQGKVTSAEVEQEPTVTDSKELKESVRPESVDAVEGASVSENVPNAPETIEANENALEIADKSVSIDINPVIGSAPVSELKDGEGVSVSEEAQNEPEKLAAEKNAVVSAEETVSVDTNPVTEIPLVNVLKEREVASVIEDVPNVPGTVDANQNASESAVESVSVDTNPAIESVPVKEDEKGAAVSEEVDNVPGEAVKESVSTETTPIVESVEGLLKVEDKVEEAGQSVSTDVNPIVEPVEDLVKPEGKAEEEVQEKAAEATEVLSEGSGIVEKSEEKTEPVLESSVESSNLDTAVEDPQVPKKAEKASESAEVAEDTTNLDTATEVPQVSLEGEKASEGEVAEDKKDDNNEGEKTAFVESRDMKVDNLDEKTEKEEVPAKSSQRQSNNIFSKMKHSLGKVKKAIIGKSPSSKTISAETKTISAETKEEEKI